MYPNSPTFSTTSAIFNLISVINVCVNFPLKLGLVVEFKGQRFTEVCNTEVGLLPDGTTSLPYCTLLNIAHDTSYLTICSSLPAWMSLCKVLITVPCHVSCTYVHITDMNYKRGIGQEMACFQRSPEYHTSPHFESVRHKKWINCIIPIMLW